jgi:hypothetical protein
MSDKSPRQQMSTKSSKTIKQKRAEKHAKSATGAAEQRELDRNRR